MLGPYGNAPFPLPAHRTGRADFPHPALRPASRPDPRRCSLRPAVELSRERPGHVGVVRLFANHRLLSSFESVPEVRVLPSTDITRFRQYYDPLRLLLRPSPEATLRSLPRQTGLPRCLHHLSNVPCPLPRRTKRVHASIASPSTRPSPFRWRVGVRIITFEACSGFTRVTARGIAQSPKATFVTRLRPSRLPSWAARQLPDQSTPIWVESSSTGDTRLSGHTAKCGSDLARLSPHAHAGYRVRRQSC